jgi:hypothetical protein
MVQNSLFTIHESSVNIPRTIEISFNPSEVKNVPIFRH